MKVTIQQLKLNLQVHLEGSALNKAVFLRYRKTIGNITEGSKDIFLTSDINCILGTQTSNLDPLNMDNKDFF